MSHNMSTRTTRRATRLYELAQFLANAPDFVPIHALAQRFGVSRHTIYRMVTDIDLELGIPVQHDPRRGVRILPEHWRFRLAVNRYEAMALFLAARVTAHYADKPNPHLQSALRKLGDAMRGTTPRAAASIAQIADQLPVFNTEEAQRYQQHLMRLADAWLESRRVLLEYNNRPGFKRRFDV